MIDLLLSFAAASALAAVHLLADRIHGIPGMPRSRWLSFAGGTSVAFVFLHLMPELHRAQDLVSREVGGLVGFIEHHVYFAALLGLVVYYGAEHAALRRNGRSGPEEQSGLEGFFWVHVGLFALFNALLGYLLVSEAREELPGLALLWAALALHTFSNDFALRRHHRDDYHRLGRWVLAGAVLVGWGVGALWPIEAAVFAFPLAFVGGGIVLNALKEELPAERESEFRAFLLGAGIYAGLMLVA